MSYDDKFLALGHEIPPITPSVPDGCNFVLYHRVDNLVYLSGYGPFWGATVPVEYMGKLGDTLLPLQGYNAARLTTINLLLILRQAIGALDKVVQILSVDGMVNCTPNFKEQPFVINGCSDLLVEIFGDSGRHTRTASGTNALGFGISVEISLTAKVRP